MTQYQTISIVHEEDVAVVYLNRPEIRNAFNEVMISELITAFGALGQDSGVRVILLKGKGKAFCAGADLNWMRAVSGYTYDQNYAESFNLSRCFYTIYICPKPTIAVVHGAAIGGANGLLAACDLAYADQETVFSLSEVKIGIVPACISPYVIKRTGEARSRELMLTGKRFKGIDAARYGLVNETYASDKLEDAIAEVISMLRTSGPAAISQCKVLIDEVSNQLTLEDALGYTAGMIAEIRASEEGQEGMSAFLDKRLPNWVKPAKL